MASKVISALVLGTGGSIVFYRYWLKKELSSKKLRDPSLMNANERFRAFASEEDRTQMTCDDFVKAVAFTKPGAPWPATTALETLFKRLDSDGDGRLSYDEYCVFTTLLSATSDNLSLAFKMFDSKRSGRIDPEGFKRIVGALSRDSSVHVSLESGVVKSLFGKNLDKTVSQADMLSLISNLRKEIRNVEFRQFDSQGKGTITLGDLRQLFRIPSRKLLPGAVDTDANTTVTNAEYHRIVDTLLRADDVSRAMEIYSLGLTRLHAKALRKKKDKTPEEQKQFEGNIPVGLDMEDFHRALLCGNASLTKHETEVLFRLFDYDCSNSLEPLEFRDMAQRKNAFFASHAPNFDDEERNWIQQWVSCMKQH